MSEVIAPTADELQHAALRENWVSFLQRFPFRWFCTMTFRQKISPQEVERLKEKGILQTSRSYCVHPERADKLWRIWCSKLNRSIYGPHWHRHADRGVYWCRALEWHRSNVPHYHALVGASVDMDRLARRLSWMDEWYALAGIARIWPIEDDELVRRYVSKYVTKGGSIDLSPSLIHFWRARELSRTQPC
ncbi:MAG: hypothetical protein WD793_13815 [Steroidobacteraceae bacterium]